MSVRSQEAIITMMTGKGRGQLRLLDPQGVVKIEHSVARDK